MSSVGLGREADEQQREGRRQALIFRVVILLVFGIILGQLWRLQIVEGPQYRERADVNRIRVSSIPPPRGIIYDRTGRIVAANAPAVKRARVSMDAPLRKCRTRSRTLAHPPCLGYGARDDRGDCAGV